MSAAVAAARTALQKAITAVQDDARVCHVKDDCPHCANAIEFAMKLADRFAYEAIEANEQSGGEQ